MRIFKSIYKGNTTLEDIEKEQIKLKRYLGHINHRNSKKKKKSDEQKETVNNIKNLHDSTDSTVMSMLRTCLEIFTNQNKEQDLKY